MSLERYMQFVAPRVGVTIPVAWGSERKVAYFRLENNLPVEIATAQDLKDAMETLMAIVEDFARKHQPPPTVTAPKKSYCKICAENGFPNTEITWPKIYNPNNKPLEPDGKTLHQHKAK